MKDLIIFTIIAVLAISVLRLSMKTELLQNEVIDLTLSVIELKTPGVTLKRIEGNNE